MEKNLRVILSFSQTKENGLRVVFSFSQTEESGLRVVFSFSQTEENGLRVVFSFSQTEESVLRVILSLSQPEESALRVVLSLSLPDLSLSLPEIERTIAARKQLYRKNTICCMLISNSLSLKVVLGGFRRIRNEGIYRVWGTTNEKFDAF